MPGFAFRLDPVLDYRQRLENEQRAVLAQALHALRSAETARDRLVAVRAELRERLRVCGAVLDPFELRAAVAHAACLDGSIAAHDRPIEEARSALGRERAELAARTRDAKSLALLKERRRARFVAECAARDQRAIDERNARSLHRGGP